MPVGTGGNQPGQGTNVPSSTPGWRLVSFQNGEVAVVRWNGHDFVWGSLHAPASPITGINWLGKNLSDFNTHDPQHPGQTYWTEAIHALPAHVQALLIGELDHGILGLKGQPILVQPTSTGAKLTGGTSPKTGSEATPVNVIPTPSISDPLGGLFGNFTDVLVRVLEGLVGVALLFLGLQALTGTGGQGQPIKTVKRFA